MIDRIKSQDWIGLDWIISHWIAGLDLTRSDRTESDRIGLPDRIVKVTLTIEEYNYYEIKYNK